MFRLRVLCVLNFAFFAVKEVFNRKGREGERKGREGEIFENSSRGVLRGCVQMSSAAARDGFVVRKWPYDKR
jgi:hypothetical protein